MILFDTSVLVDCLSGSRRSLPNLVHALESGERMILCALVAYEWLRGPRTGAELDAQEALFPCALAIPFEAADAQIAARLYTAVRRARSREADIAIAACAIRREAELWTLNTTDFSDIPGLRLFTAD
ncbi:MAG TPA: PIN domain-containing protein [Bryobacteraceae bacterium]|nr:PIN domain-containing protein [Bryobacteraceae bacterium]